MVAAVPGGHGESGATRTSGPGRVRRRARGPRRRTGDHRRRRAVDLLRRAGRAGRRGGRPARARPPARRRRGWATTSARSWPYLGVLRGGHVALVVPADDPVVAARILEGHEPDCILAGHGDEVVVEECRRGSAHDLHPDLALLLSTSGSTGSPEAGAALARQPAEQRHGDRRLPRPARPRTGRPSPCRCTTATGCRCCTATSPWAPASWSGPARSSTPASGSGCGGSG